MSASAEVLVTLCTYNERANLESLIPEIWRQAPEAHVLVVDDSSPDGTSAWIADWARREPRLRLLQRSGKQGLGTATLASLQYAIEHHYGWVLNLDADFSHPPQYIPDLLALRAHCDVAIASRYVPGGGVVGWPLRRHCMSRAINWYTRLLLGIPARDCSGAFRCMRVALLRQIDLGQFLSRGYAVQEELLYRLHRAGARLAETPFVYAQRRHGSSKINVGEGIVALRIIFRLAVWGG
ncbi:MAG: polyprenol monophosphomannose synthase [Planctomycetaceae bacterium]